MFRIVCDSYVASFDWERWSENGKVLISFMTQTKFI